MSSIVAAPREHCRGHILSLAAVSMSATLKKFFETERGATFNLCTSQILWWALGAPVAFKYGYSNETDSDGAYPSGNYGSGVYPITVRAICINGRARRPRRRRRAPFAGTTSLLTGPLTLPAALTLPPSSSSCSSRSLSSCTRWLVPGARERAACAALTQFRVAQVHYFFFPTEEELDERLAQDDLEKRRSSHKVASS